jgi:hypothetical protein
MRFSYVAMLLLLLFGNGFAACPDATQPINIACPELYAKLDHEGLVTALDLSPETAADSQLVAQLQQYLDAANAPQSSRTDVDSAALDAMIAENYRAAKRAELSFMERLAAWWDALFADDDKTPKDYDFWRKLMPTESFARVLFYGLSGLLIAFLLVYGWREMQPFLDAKRLRTQHQRAVQQRTQVLWPPVVAGLAAPAALGKVFQAMVAVLTERKRLPEIPGLTHAELAREFASHDPAVAQAFQNVTQKAAAVLFTEQAVSAEELAQYLRTAELIVQTQAPSKASPKAVSQTHA